MSTICAGLTPQWSEKYTDLEMSQEAQEALDVAIGG